MTDNSNGRKWARFWLVVALLVSVVANVAHTVLADSAISLWLRIPGAVVWPLFTFAGIEVVVRMIWERRWTHSVTRWAILAAAVPAAITSYTHQYNLLGMMGEAPHTQVIGPLAIDGFMVGLTMALLLTRPVPAGTEQPAPAARAQLSELDADEVLERWTEQLAPVSPAPLTEQIEAVYANAVVGSEQPGEQPRRRAGNAELEQKVRSLIADPELKVGTENSTVRRYAKVARALRDNPAAVIDCKAEKVRPELVAIMREHFNLERVR